MRGCFLQEKKVEQYMFTVMLNSQTQIIDIRTDRLSKYDIFKLKIIYKTN